LWDSQISFDDLLRRIIVPISNLLKKSVAFHWSAAANDAFKRLKKAFTTVPNHFDPSRPAILETDALDYADGGVVSQYDDDGVLHPCAFFSLKFTAAELNYEIYDKEMLCHCRLPSDGFNAILVCMDRLKKMAHFCPTTTNVTAEDTARLYL